MIDDISPSEETIKHLIDGIYLIFLCRKFIWKEIPDHDPHIPPVCRMIYGIDNMERVVEVDKDWFDDSLLSIPFDRFISIDSVEVKKTKTLE